MNRQRYGQTSIILELLLEPKISLAICDPKSHFRGSQRNKILHIWVTSYYKLNCSLSRLIEIKMFLFCCHWFLLFRLKRSSRGHEKATDMVGARVKIICTLMSGKSIEA